MTNLKSLLADIVEDVYKTEDAIAAWGRGDTDWPLTLKNFLGWFLFMGSGVAAVFVAAHAMGFLH